MRTIVCTTGVSRNPGLRSRRLPPEDANDCLYTGVSLAQGVGAFMPDVGREVYRRKIRARVEKIRFDSARDVFLIGAVLQCTVLVRKIQGLQVLDAVRFRRVGEIVAGGFVSAIGHGGAAEFPSRPLGIKVPVNRITADLQLGDRAIVLRLTERLPDGAVLTEEQMCELPFELGLLSQVRAPGL